MAELVVPYRGSRGKTRLAGVGPERERLSLAMLADVVASCAAVGTTTVVTGDEDAASVATELGARVVADPGGGQGPAVAAALMSPPPGSGR